MSPASGASAPVRLAMAGLGWIGRHRMEAMSSTGLCEVVAVCDPSADARASVLAAHPNAMVCDSFEALLESRADGVVIASPSALHAHQTIAALQSGHAVFCQKPLGRTAEETHRAVSAAEQAGRLLGVDLSYRHAAGMVEVLSLVREGALGPLHHLDMTFHNAYGPDKAWFYDPALSGGGCMVDLGVHLVDLAQLLMGEAAVIEAEADLFAGGRRLHPPVDEVEDLALATLRFDSGAVARLACSWRAPAGRDAVISVEAYGARGGAAFQNVAGSFYDFIAERREGARHEVLTRPPDDWGGRAAISWLRSLAERRGFDPAVWGLVTTAEVIDRLYGRSSKASGPRTPRPAHHNALAGRVL